MMRRTALALVALLLAGCAGAPAPGDDEPAPIATALQAPWWEIGESWTITFEQAGKAPRTTTMVNFANNTFNDPAHFWLGVASRQEALDHVFFENNPFLGRIHWEILAPHEKGMHSAMYDWPLENGTAWTSPILFGHEEISLTAAPRGDGGYVVEGVSRKDDASFRFDYDPATRWFRDLEIRDAGGALSLLAHVDEHGQDADGTYYFLRGRDYIDSSGGSTGQEETFTVKEEGATSIAFLLNVRASGPAAYVEFVDPSGAVFHRETLALGTTADKVVEVAKHPPAGEWTLRYVGTVTGEIKVRGVIEYKGTV